MFTSPSDRPGAKPGLLSGLLQWLQGIAALGFLIALFMAGFTMAQFLLAHDIRRKDEQIKEKDGRISGLEIEQRKTLAELNQVKLEFAQYRERKPLTSPSTNIPPPTLETRDPFTPPKSLLPATPRSKPTSTWGSQALSVQVSSSAATLGGEVIISLVAVEFGGSPLRHRVIANVGSPRGKAVRIEKEDVGYTLSPYNTDEASFQVRITSASSFSATFAITRLQR